MASTLVKSPDQIRMEILINNFGYILLQLFLLIMKITFVVVVIAAKLLRLPTIYTVLSAWLYPTTFARRTRLACKFVSHCVSPWTVYAVFFTFGVSRSESHQLIYADNSPSRFLLSLGQL